MTHDEYARHVDAFLAEMKDVTTRKNADYSAGTDQALYDYYHTASEVGLTPFQSWAVLFMKHVHAVLKHVKTGRVESEPIRGRFIDIANYAMLGCALAEDGETKITMIVQDKEDKNVEPGRDILQILEDEMEYYEPDDFSSVDDLLACLDEHDDDFAEDVRTWMNHHSSITGSALLSSLRKVMQAEYDAVIAGVST